jgi:hypothetical protein
VLGQIVTLLLPAITAAAQSGNLMNWVRSNNTSQLTASLLSSARWIVRLRTNNPLERILREIRRRTRVVGAPSRRTSSASDKSASRSWRKSGGESRRAERREGRAHRVSGARQRCGGVEKYSSIASRQAPEHGSTAISPEADSRISATAFSAQLMQTPARSIPQPVQLQLDL